METMRNETDLWELQEQVRKKEGRIFDLQQEIQEDRDTLENLKEDVLEAKIRRIAMEEITRDSRESMLRNLGYVESFYGYPDMAKKEKKAEQRSRQGQRKKETRVSKQPQRSGCFFMEICSKKGGVMFKQRRERKRRDKELSETRKKEEEFYGNETKERRNENESKLAEK